MSKIDILLRLTRIKENSPVSEIPWILRLIFIFPLIFLISPQNFFSYNTIIIFLANVFLTASGFIINDLEDAEDDYHDLEKRKRNPIANNELTKKQGYLIGFSFLFIGLSLLLTISYLVFLVGLVLISVGIVYSWKPIRLKSIPIIDLISHSISLGILQFSTTYLTFRSFGLQFISLLMIIIPFSVAIDILQEVRDFSVDKKAKINNTIQKFGRFNPTKFFVILGTIIVTGFGILCSTIDRSSIFFSIFLSLSILSGIIILLRTVVKMRKFSELYYS